MWGGGHDLDRAFVYDRTPRSRTTPDDYWK